MWKLLLVVACFSSYAALGQDLTYREIQPILKKNCLQCHKKDGIAPITFGTYKDVVKSALLIKKVILIGYMPPWKPDPTYTHFTDERILPSEDKAKLIAWIDNQCPKGSTPAATNEKSEKPTSEQNGITFTLPFNIHIAASTRDTNVWVEMPYQLEKDTFVSSYEFVTSKKNGIHHALFVVNDATDLPGNNYYEEDFFDGKKMNHRVFNNSVLSLMGGWVPGSTPYALPGGIGYYLPRRGIISFQIHYGPPAKSFDDCFSVKLTYSTERIKRIVMVRKYGTGGGINEPYPPLLVPPDSVMHFALESQLSDSFSLMAVGPHMHLLGKKFTAWILKPNGDTIPLIRINDWDFNWQGFYYLPHLMKIEKGSVLQADVVLDNTNNNIRNPNNPPRYVRDGNDTKDEMIQLVVLLVPYRKGDEELQMRGKVVE